MRPIGVFDSGVGGLTVFHAIERAVPGRRLIYFGDTARVPYGTRSPETVVRYSLEAAKFLADRGIGMLVVACNTASSVALGAMAEASRVPVLGVILPGARRAVEATKTGRIGVIGTRATVGSSAYATEIRALRPGMHVIERACPLFVPLAEEGWTDDEIAEGVARRYLQPLKEEGIDTLVLGCTHYPLLREVIGRTMGPDVTLVDSAEVVAAEIRERLSAEGEDETTEAHEFWVTDVPAPFQQVAERFLGRPIRNLHQIGELSS